MTGAPIKVLAIDDEPPIRKLLRMGLATQGYEILEAPSGKVALEKLAEGPALIILDLGLPDIDGHELLRTIRSRNESIPIVVLSSRGDEAGKVKALDLGADDYITKPFSIREFRSRVRALLRRSAIGGDTGSQDLIALDGVEIDAGKRTVHLNGDLVTLTFVEFELLRAMASNPGRVFTRQVLLESLWGNSAYREPRTIDVHVRHLREKLEADPRDPQLILTVRGVGYRSKG